MTGKLSTTLRDLERQLSAHAKAGLPMTAKDARTLASALGACAGYAVTLEGRLRCQSGPFGLPTSATLPIVAAPNPHDKNRDAAATVLRFPPRVRVVVTQSVQPPEGDSA